MSEQVWFALCETPVSCSKCTLHGQCKLWKIWLLGYLCEALQQIIAHQGLLGQSACRIRQPHLKQKTPRSSASPWRPGNRVAHSNTAVTIHAKVISPVYFKAKHGLQFQDFTVYGFCVQFLGFKNKGFVLRPQDIQKLLCSAYGAGLGSK